MGQANRQSHFTFGTSTRGGDGSTRAKSPIALRCDFLPECYMHSIEIRERRRKLRYQSLPVRQVVQLKTRLASFPPGRESTPAADRSLGGPDYRTDVGAGDGRYFALPINPTRHSHCRLYSDEQKSADENRVIIWVVVSAIEGDESSRGGGILVATTKIPDAVSRTALRWVSSGRTTGQQPVLEFDPHQVIHGARRIQVTHATSLNLRRVCKHTCKIRV